MSKGPREWVPGKKHQKILWDWTGRATDILAKVAKRLVSEGFDLGNLESEDWRGSLTWAFPIKGRVGDELAEDGWVHVTIGFHPVEDKKGMHTASFSLLEGGGSYLEDFALSEQPIDLSDQAQVEKAFVVADQTAPKAIDLLLEHDWEPFEE